MDAKMDKIVSEFSRDQKDLISILHRLQSQFTYVPPEAISLISKHLNISESEIYGVLTFYKFFSLEPRGKNIVTVCLGTACHVRGGVQIVEEMERKLNIAVGQTTEDGEFSLETVNCLGCCAIGPVVVVNGKYYSQVTLKKIDSILKEYKTSG